MYNTISMGSLNPPHNCHCIAISQVAEEMTEYLKKRDQFIQNSENQMGETKDRYLSLEATRSILANVKPKLCQQMSPRDLNAALFLELSILRTPRGVGHIRKYHIGLFHYHREAIPPFIEVQCPSDCKNTNSAQCDRNKNIGSIYIKQGTVLFKLIKMHFRTRGDVTIDAFFLQALSDWKVCSSFVHPMCSVNILFCMCLFLDG